MLSVHTILLISSLFCGAPAFAGTGHDHGPGGSHSHGPISSDAAANKAEKRVKSLIERGKLDKSWADAKVVDTAQKDFGKGAEWVVTIRNEKATDAAKKNLFVFYTLNGNYIATNFTGK